MKKHLLLTASLMLNGIVFAQSPPCATDSLQYLYEQADPHYSSSRESFTNRVNNYRQHPPTSSNVNYGDPSTSLTLGCRTTRYLIPVVFHINHDSAVQISDTQVYQQMQILNDAFLPYNIQFFLAKKRPNGAGFNGINRFSPTLNNTNNELSVQMASLTQSGSGSNYFNPARYLNIYVVKEILENGQQSTLAAYNSSYPWQNYTDGIVIRHERLGDYTTCTNCGPLAIDSRGKVLIHEIGHYLGLYHSFEGGCTGGYTESTCSIQGDLCCDTRPVQGKGTSCSIDTSVRSCSTYYLAIPEDRTNYMEYSGEACLDHFTPDQVSIMHASLELYRPNLIHTENVNLLDSLFCASSAWFDADNNQLCPGDTMRLSGHQYTSSVDYFWEFRYASDSSVYLDTTLNQYTWDFVASDTGVFDVTLRIVAINGDTIGITRHRFLTVSDCGSLLASTQGRWFFGDHAGLFFSSSGAFKDIEPSRVPPNIHCSEGSISQCDSAGNLLFYGGALTPNDFFNPEFHFQIFDKNYLPMPGGRIKGDPSAAQGGLVIPVPGSSTRYYVVSSSGSNDAQSLMPDSIGLRYTIIDMSLNSGLGGIDPNYLNVPVQAPSGSEVSVLDSSFLSGEFLTAIPKCGSDEYWIITNDISSGSYANSDLLTIFSVSSGGITHHQTTDIVCLAKGGQLKASPDGSFIATVEKILRFDRSTGTVSEFRDIPVPNNWGKSFSPDSKKLYLLEVASTNNAIWQLDLQSSDSSLSAIVVGHTGQGTYDQLQLGPDAKIYFAQEGKSRLGMIENPDLLGNLVQNNACGYTTQGPITQSGGLGGTSTTGLPNMVDAQKTVNISLDFIAIDSACGTVAFYPNDLCAGSYQWDFGDGSSTSSLISPKHTYSTKDSFEVTLTVNGSTQVSKKIKIGLDAPEIFGITEICDTSTEQYYTIANPNPFVRYSWSSDSGTVLPDISSPYGTRVLWNHPGSLFVEAYYDKNGCRAYDTLSVVFNILGENHITDSVSSCFATAPVTFDGNAALSTLGNMQYQWQISHDSLNWIATGIADTLEDLTLSELDSTAWYRRKAVSSTCISYSNMRKLVPAPGIIKDLTTVAICGPGPETHSFPIELANPAGDIWMEFDHYKEVSPGNWGWTMGSPVNYPDSFPTSVDEGDSVKIRVIRSGCEQYTQTVAVKRVRLIPDPLNTSVPHPLNMTVTQDYININRGTPTVITASLHDTLRWLQSAGNGDEFFQWQKCHTLVVGGYTPWEDIPGANNDTLFLSGDYCDRGNYRVILRSYWFKDDMCIDLIPPDFASVSIPEYIWSKDGAADTAAEPNQDPNEDYWNSPDLWNCWKSTNCTTHESPEFMQNGSNQVRTTIRNTGTHSSGPFQVMLYWTLGGFYEKWPLSWHEDLVNNGFYNPNDGNTYPMGSEIDTIDISNMPGGTSITVSALWTPPYPGWYDTSSYYNADELKHPLCILSRIVTCDDEYPYGMTINEIEPTGDNVINNNNIVTRNTEVYDSIGNNKKTPVYVLRMGNQSSNGPQKLRVALDNVISNYWTLGYFTVRFSGNIYDAWNAGGKSGANYTLSGDEFKVTKDDFYLDNIVLDGDEWGWMYVQFHLNPGVSITTYQGTQLFRFVQSSSDTSSESYQADGGFNFLLNLLPVIYSPPEMVVPESKEKEAEQGAELLTWVQNRTEEQTGEDKPEQGVDRKKVGTTVVATTAKAYPNPSSGIIYFDLNLESEREISIELYDGLGKKMREIPQRAYPSGEHTLSLNGSQLAPGPYLAKINVNGEVKAVTVIITR